MFLSSSKEDIDYINWQGYCLKEALLKTDANGPRYMTTGLAIDQRCNLEDGIELYSVIDGKTQHVGKLPLVGWSYGLNCYLTLASVRSDFAGSATAYK